MESTSNCTIPSEGKAKVRVGFNGVFPELKIFLFHVKSQFAKTFNFFKFRTCGKRHQKVPRYLAGYSITPGQYRQRWSRSARGGCPVPQAGSIAQLCLPRTAPAPQLAVEHPERCGKRQLFPCTAFSQAVVEPPSLAAAVPTGGAHSTGCCILAAACPHPSFPALLAMQQKLKIHKCHPPSCL